MRQEKHVLEYNEAEIQANKDFTEWETEQHIVKETLPSGSYVTNCLKCNCTCHQNCPYPNDENKKRCSVMDRAGYCKVYMCPGHCHWTTYDNNSFQYVEREVKVKKIRVYVQNKYNDAIRRKATAEAKIRKA